MKRVISTSITKPVQAAEGDIGGLEDEINVLEDDFEFVTNGFLQLQRMGKDYENSARAILLELSGNVAAARTAIAEELGGGAPADEPAPEPEPEGEPAPPPEE